MTISDEFENRTEAEDIIQVQRHIVENLISNKKESSTIKETSNFIQEWSTLASLEGLANDSVSLLFEGFSIAGSRPLFVLMNTNSSCLDCLKQLQKLSVVQKNNQGSSLRMYTHLFSLAVNDGRNEDCLKSIISNIPRYALNKEGVLFGTNTKIFTKYLLKELDNNVAEISLANISIIEPFAQKLLNIFQNTFDEIAKKNKPSSKEAVTSILIKEWLESQISSEQTSISSDVAESASQTIKDTQRRVGAKLDHTKKIIECDSSLDECANIAPTYDYVIEAIKELAKENETIKARYVGLQTAAESDKEIIESLTQQLYKEQETTSTLHETLVEKNKEIESLRRQLENCKQDLKTITETVEAKSQIISMLNKSSEKNSGETLARIATKLKADYGDFKEYEDSPMTEELGEIVKLQLGEVFETLKAAGVKL